MSASNEQLGEQAREETLREIIAEEEQRLGKFVIQSTMAEDVDSEALSSTLNAL